MLINNLILSLMKLCHFRIRIREVCQGITHNILRKFTKI